MAQKFKGAAGHAVRVQKWFMRCCINQLASIERVRV